MKLFRLLQIVTLALVTTACGENAFMNRRSKVGDASKGARLAAESPGNGIVMTKPSVIATYNTATIHWTTDVESDGVVAVWPSSNTTARTKVLQQTKPSTDHVVALSDLEPSTKYGYQVASSRYGMTRSWSGDFTTESVKLSITAAPTAVNILADSATITWPTNIPSGGTVNYGLLPSASPFRVLQKQALAASHAILLTNLTPQTQYRFQVVSNVYGQTASWTASFNTPSLSPISMTKPVVDTTLTSAVVSWTTNMVADGKVLYGGPSQPNRPLKAVQTGQPGAQHTVLLAGLIPGTSYSFQVVTSGHGMTTSWTSSFATPAAAIAVDGVAREIAKDFFGANIEQQYGGGPYCLAEARTTSAIKSFGFSSLRFPGGGVANYWDWEHDSTYPLFPVNVLGDTLASFAALAKSSQATPLFVLNLLTFSNTDQVAITERPLQCLTDQSMLLTFTRKDAPTCAFASAAVPDPTRQCVLTNPTQPDLVAQGGPGQPGLPTLVSQNAACVARNTPHGDVIPYPATRAMMDKQIAFLKKAHDTYGLEIARVELGNEFDLGQATPPPCAWEWNDAAKTGVPSQSDRSVIDYWRRFQTTPEDPGYFAEHAVNYGMELNQWATAIRQSFPEIKLAAVGGEWYHTPSRADLVDRVSDWGVFTLPALRGGASGINSLIVHRYESLNESERHLDPAIFLGMAFKAWDGIQQSSIPYFDRFGFTTWITEFDLVDRTADQFFSARWMHGLYDAVMAVQLLGERNIDQMTVYDFHGPSRHSSMIYSGNETFLSGSDMVKAEPDTLSAMGHTLRVISLAVQGATKASSVSFGNVPLISPTNSPYPAYPALVGAKTTRVDGSSQYVLINLSAEELPVQLESGFVAMESVAAPSLSTLIVKSQSVTVTTVSLSRGQTVVKLRPYSVSRVYQ